MPSSSSRKDGLDWTMAAGIGAVAGATSKTVVAPLERIRLLLQMQKQGVGTASSSSGLAMSVLQTEGAAGLWRGNGLAVARAMVQKGMLFSTQDQFSKALGSDTLAGGVAGLASSGLTYPLDLLRTRLAGQVGTGSLVELARDSVRAHGVLALWRGASATLVGGVVFEGARFGLFGCFKRQFSESGEGGVASRLLLGPAAWGTVASLFAGNIIYPNDTVRRRLQLVEAAGESYLDATRALLREGGVARLYRGFLLYNLKAAPSAAMTFFTYHELKRLVSR
jgi:solute carrier family 25 phosphate transporter 23/24/25/41